MPVEAIKAKIQGYAHLYDVDPDLMDYIVRNESGYNPKARNYNPPVEDSVGLAQINLLAHKNITKAQAQDPDFSLNFLAEHLSKGKCSMWTTCQK